MPEDVQVIEQVAAPEQEALKEDDPRAGNEHIVPGPTQELEGVTEKKMAKVVKEGGKRGVEIEGAADMGGLQFFCTMMGEMTEGKVDLLVESMKAMNAISDPSEEERKGGAGRLGKMIFSFTEKPAQCLSAVAYVPANKSDECSAKEWLTQVMLDCGVPAKRTEELMKTYEDQTPAVSSRNWAAIQVDQDGASDIFPIKMRDPAISHAYTFLKKRGLFPEDDDEDDDEYVFGDEDFP